jgi:hypothetical protein
MTSPNFLQIGRLPMEASFWPENKRRGEDDGGVVGDLQKEGST